MQKKHKPILPYDSPDGQPYEELYGVASSTDSSPARPSTLLRSPLIRRSTTCR